MVFFFLESLIGFTIMPQRAVFDGIIDVLQIECTF